jgi:recombination protein RecT
MSQQQQQVTTSDKKDWHKIIASSEEKFTSSGLEFTQEQIFATQMLMHNSYLMDVAIKNPTSLRLAMYNVAAVGLSLNPNQGLAYLVPRRLKSSEDPKVMLDISYRGLISIGVESGAIHWAKPELVYSNDKKFVYKGAAQIPEHDFDPFDTDRGNVRGGYCIAELSTGGVLVEAMSKADMDKIRNKSEAYKKGFGPWKDWEDQMQLKSIVKRASKWWPISTPRMATALKILNEDNGEGLAVLANDKAVITQLPSPPDRDDVPVIVQNNIQKMLDRAVTQNAYEACRELMQSRIKDPSHLSFAISELEKAKILATQPPENGIKTIN